MTDYSELIYYLTNPEISDKKSYITLAAEAITKLKNENECLYQSYCYVLSLCHIFAPCQTCGGSGISLEKKKLEFSVKKKDI